MLGRKESNSLVKKAGKVLTDLSLSLSSNRPIANSAATAKFNEIDSNLTASDNLKFKFSKSGSQYGYLNSNGTFVPFKNPAGTLSITSNGTYNVTDYASASVAVPQPTNPRYGALAIRKTPTNIGTDSYGQPIYGLVPDVLDSELFSISGATLILKRGMTLGMFVTKDNGLIYQVTITGVGTYTSSSPTQTGNVIATANYFNAYVNLVAGTQIQILTGASNNNFSYSMGILPVYVY